MSTSYPCPQCGATASLADGCPACGAAPDADAAEVIRLDGEIAGLRRQLEEARARVSGLDQRIQDAHHRRTQLAHRVVARRGPAPSPHHPAPVRTAPSLTTAGPALTPVASAEPRLSVLTVQNVLFTLGGLLLVVAAAVFTAVAWAQVGVTGRALLLAGATVAVLAVPPFAARRGLTAAAETLAAVGLLMILLDGFAAWAVDFLFVKALEPSGYAAAVLTFTAVTALAYSWPTKLRGPRIAALLMAQPVLPLLAAAADAGLTGWSLAFSAVAVLDVVVLRARPARFAPDAAGILAYVCAALAAAVATTIAFAGMIVSTTPLAAAEAGSVLLLPPLILLAWALMARLPHAQAIGAGLVVVTLGVAAARWSWTLPIDIRNSGWPGSRIALIALLLAMVVALIRRLPTPAGPVTASGPAVSSPAVSSPAAASDLGTASGPSATDPAAEALINQPATGSAAGTPTDQPTDDSVGGSPATTPTADSAARAPGGPPAADSVAGVPRGGAAPDGRPSNTGAMTHRGQEAAVDDGAAGRTSDARGGLLQRWLPVAVRNGARVGALVVAAVPAVTVVLAATAGAIRSTATAGQVWTTPMSATVNGIAPDMLAATVLTAVAYALLLPRRAHADLSLTALAALGFMIPAAFGLPWWTAAVAGVAVAAVALLLAARSRNLTDTCYRIAICLVAATHAVVTGCGQAAVAAAVCGAIAVLGLGTAGALRNASRGAASSASRNALHGTASHDTASHASGGPASRGTSRAFGVGAGSLVAGLVAVPPAVWLALFAADIAVTTRVRVSLGVVALLCAVAHAVTRRLPGYGPYALGVALLAAGTTPLWAAPGGDPLVLHAAAGLLLVVALLPIPATRTGGGAIAALLPGATLLALTAGDLAVVVLEPWAALGDIWSGVPPQQSPVAWAAVVALTAAAGAAAATGWLLARSTHDSASSAGAAPAGPEPLDPGGPDLPTAASATASLPTAATAPADTTPPGPAAPERPVRGPAVAPSLAAMWSAAPLIALVVPMVFAAAGSAWPVMPIAALVTGLAGLLAVAVSPARHTVTGTPTAGTAPAGHTTTVPSATGAPTGHTASSPSTAASPTSHTASSPSTAGATGRHMATGPLAVLSGVLAASGIAGSTAGHGATIIAFSLLLVASAVAGLAARGKFDRIAGWTLGTVSVVVLAYAIADLTDLGVGAPPLFVLAAAAVAVALEAALASRRPGEAPAPFLVGHASAVIALLITDSLGWAALVCKLWALVLTVRAMRPGETRRTRFRYAIASGSVALIGWWFLLSSRDVETTEIYTLPAAALAMVAGWFARRARPGLSSWAAYGAALAAAFLPTLAVIADSTAGEPHYLRRLLLGLGALLVLLAGARARLQAPVITGGGTLLLVALHELIQFWDLVPRWMPLAVGGLLLVGVATTMEQRRRDLARLRAAVGRMT